MKTDWGRLGSAITSVARDPKLRKRLVVVLALFVILQVYFVREMIAAELLFGLGFVGVLLLVGVCYLVGALGERGLKLMEMGVRSSTPWARRTYKSLEEISRKPFRHPRSESAQ